MLVRSLGQEYPLEEGMATHSSTLAWRIVWPEEPGSRKESDITEAASQHIPTRMSMVTGLKTSQSVSPTRLAVRVAT